MFSVWNLSPWNLDPFGSKCVPFPFPQAAAYTRGEGKGEGGCIGAGKGVVGSQGWAGRHPPLPEVSIEQPVGESLATDPDPLQNPIAAKLV